MKRAVPLAVAALVIVALGAEVVRLRRQLAPPDRTYEIPTGAHRAGITPEVERELERLATLGYVAGSEPAPKETGVLTHDRSAALPGLTLYTYGGLPEAVLIDMEGDIVHSWTSPGAMYWARAFVMRNGDLLAIATNPPYMMKLTRDSDLTWKFEGKAHHDFAVMQDGTIYVLVRESVSRPDMRRGEPILDDNVVVLGPDGRELRRVSLLDAFRNSELGREWLVDHPFPDDADIFHTNSIQVLGVGEVTHVLLSIRSIDTVAVLDMETAEIVWLLDGPWHMQHEAEIIDGKLLLFDNLGLSRELGSAGQSRVLEIDVQTLQLVWSYTAPGFFTHGAGAQQRLPNGNTLITESIKGRLIEVTPEGRIVWEFVNPLTVETDPDLILGILRAERIPVEVARGWARGL